MRSLLLIAAASCLYAAPTLRLTNSVVGPISVALGENTPTEEVGAYNIGDGSLSLTLSVPSSVKWLSASIGSTQPCPLGPYQCTSLRFTPNTASLPAGSYTAAVTVSDAYAADSPQVITVTVLVGNARPAIDVQMDPGATAEFRFQGDALFCFRGCAEPTAAVQTGSHWLSLSIVTDSRTTISLSWHWQIRVAPPLGMGTGVYRGAVSTTGPNSATTIPVTLRIGSASAVVASPEQIDVKLAQDGPPLTAPFLSPITLSKPGVGRVDAENVNYSGSGISAYITAGSVIVSVDPAGRAPGDYYDGHVTLGCALADCPVDVPVRLEIAPKAAPQLTGVVNNANFSQYAPTSPGEVMVLKGEQLSNSAASFATSTPLPISLGGVSVTVDGVAVPLYYSSARQVCFQMPYSATTGTASIQLFRDGQASNVARVDVVPRAPQIVAVTGADYTLRDADHPAHRGELLILWAIGLGQTTPAVIAGAMAPSNPLATLNPLPVITVGNDAVEASFACLAPGQVGLYQINFTLPASTAPGPAPVRLGFRNDYFSDSVVIPIL